MSYQLITLTNNITLSWTYPFTKGTVVADINNVEANAEGFTITLPPANLVSTGTTILFNNIGFYEFVLLNNNGAPVGLIILSDEIRMVYLTDNSTVAGIWQVIPFGGGSAGITNFSVGSSNNSITIFPQTVTPTTSNIDFALSTSLENLDSFSNTLIPGFLVATANNPATWVTRSFIGGTNISITYPDGVASGTVINLQSTLTNLTSVTTSDSANNSSVITPTQIIITDSTTGNICNITSAGINTASGLGALNLNGVNIDKSSNVTSVNSLTTANLIVTNSISSIPGLNVGNLLLNDSTITTKNANSDLILSASGLGALVLNNVNIDSSANISNINTLTGSEIISPNIITEAINAPTNILTINNIQIDSSKNINDVNKLTAISVNAVTLQVTDSIISPNIVTTNINSGTNSALTINGVYIDTSRNIENINTLTATSVNTTTLTTENLNISGNINTPRIAAAWCCFTDTGQGCTSSIVLQDSYNVKPVIEEGITGGAGTYTIKFITPLSSTYAVVTSLQRQGTNLTPFQSFVMTKSTTSVVVQCTDTLGNLLPPIDGLSVVIFSN